MSGDNRLFKDCEKVILPYDDNPDRRHAPTGYFTRKQIIIYFRLDRWQFERIAANVPKYAYHKHGQIYYKITDFYDRCKLAPTRRAKRLKLLENRIIRVHKEIEMINRCDALAKAALNQAGKENEQ